MRFVSLLSLMACVCACESRTGKPLHTFPSRAELSQLAASSQAKRPLELDQVTPEQWALELAPAASQGPADALLASLIPTAKHTPALDCVARQFARLASQTGGKAPSSGLRRFISARCGALVALPLFQSWVTELPDAAEDEAVFAELRRKQSKAIDHNAKQAGFALVRDEGKVAIAVAYGSPDVEVEPLEQRVGDDGVLAIRGRVLFDADSLQAWINDGEHGVRRCELDPALALPEFALRCELAPGDDAAWVEVLATPRGRVLAQDVLAVLALRSEDAASAYSPLRVGEARPVTNAADFRASVLELLNAIRGDAGLPALSLASKQSQVANSVTPAFFGAMFDGSESSQHMVDAITLGLIAGWDVRGGMIRDGGIAASVVVDTTDAERWLAETLERPIGRAVLLDRDARVLALGAIMQSDPGTLGALALTYAFFEEEAKPGERAMQVLERLARVRQARGLGRTVLVRDTSGMDEQLARIHRGETTPGEALRGVMKQASSEAKRGVQGFVWETQDLDLIEFPHELLRKGDLILGAGVTYYRAPGGAWGQYTVLFVVFSGTRV